MPDHKDVGSNRQVHGEVGSNEGRDTELGGDGTQLDPDGVRLDLPGWEVASSIWNKSKTCTWVFAMKNSMCKKSSSRLINGAVAISP